MAIAALATLSLGVVLGPEAPLIAIGGGLGLLSVNLAKRDAPPTAAVVMASAGSFAAISTLFGSPILGAFLLMEAAGLGGPLLELVLRPGTAGRRDRHAHLRRPELVDRIRHLLTGHPRAPPFHHPTGALFLWAIVFGLVASVLGTGIRLIGLALLPRVEPRRLLLTPVLGLAVAGLAIAFAEISGRSFTEVLFSGQSALPGLVQHAAGWTVGALVLLVVCKGLAYGISLSSFRGGPVFPSMFIGAAAGIAASHLPGMSLVPGVAMGIGAMCTVMLKLPMTSTLLATLLLFSDGVEVIPVVIVAVVVAYVATAWLPQTPADLRKAKAPRPAAPGNAAPRREPLAVDEPARRRRAAPPVRGIVTS